jgi:hypothetical protein
MLDYEAAMGVAKEMTKAVEMLHMRTRADVSRSRDLPSHDKELTRLLESEEPVQSEHVGA